MRDRGSTLYKVNYEKWELGEGLERERDKGECVRHSVNYGDIYNIRERGRKDHYNVLYLQLFTSHNKGVEIFGSEFEDLNRRKHYTSINELHKRTWNPTSTSRVTLSQLIGKLLQLLKDMFSTWCANAPTDPMFKYCMERFRTEKSGCLNLAQPDVQFLTLIYADSDLLFQLLQILNLLTAHASQKIEVPVYEDFILFLYKNCKEHSCFFQPIQRVFDRSPVSTRLSKLFISLITKSPSSALSSKENHSLNELVEFITCGGGLTVLKSLIGASKEAACVSSNKDFSVHAINKLGQKDTPPKTISDSSNLVDFFPLSVSYINSSKGRVKVTQSPRSLSLLQHNYSTNENWIQLHIVLSHPFLLHNFICCMVPIESGTAAHSGPSKVIVYSSTHGGSNSPVPITPIFDSSSLRMVNIVFHQPVLTQEVIVHFHRPLLSSTVVLSKVEMLGSNFGSNAESISSGKTQSDLQHQLDLDLPG